jgi:hypothetical protein
MRPSTPNRGCQNGLLFTKTSYLRSGMQNGTETRAQSDDAGFSPLDSLVFGSFASVLAREESRGKLRHVLP